MTRKKVKLAFITNDSARKATYKKRKKGLMKKVTELTTLCDIDACAIIYSPYDSKPEVWPSSLGVHRVLAYFKTMPEMEQSKKMMNQESFLRQRINKAHEQLKKQKKDNREMEMARIMFQSLTDMIPGDSASKRNWGAMSDVSLGVIRSKSESHEIQYLKRSKTSPQTPYSNFTINIEDLPDPLLFEILLRLPAKSAARYKCVSKRWFALISHHTLFSRFLCLQRDKRNPLPMEPTLIFLDDDKGFFATSELPVFETGSFSLDFLPCYQTARTKKLVEFDSPVVVATCNDLVLCCALMLQRDYYICNPYTKQWTAIPPAPQCCYEIRVGFTCEPYYYYKEDVDHQSEKASNSTVHLNADYKYAIVRIHSPLFGSSLNSSELNVEIFSSETGVAYNGKLYWVHDLGHSFMIELDPFSNNNHFDVVDLPDNEWGAVSVSPRGTSSVVPDFVG
ncbi:hypothetical protein ACLB2K_064375 [Fragaria x ananassa]